MKNISDGINHKLIAYGAGDAAKKNIKLYDDVMKISEIWDSYSKEDFLYGIPINRPQKSLADEVVIVFIDKERIREDVINYLIALGHRHIFYYLDVDRLRWQISNYCRQNTDGDAERYELTALNHVPVLFLALDNELRKEMVNIPKPEDKAKEELRVRLNEKILITYGVIVQNRVESENLDEPGRIKKAGKAHSSFSGWNRRGF